MLRIKATIRFKSEEDGGLAGGGVAGMRPSFAVAKQLIMCEVLSIGTVSQFAPGQTYEVIIELGYGDMFCEEIIEGYQFALNFGAMEFATGIVDTVLENMPSKFKRDFNAKEE